MFESLMALGSFALEILLVAYNSIHMATDTVCSPTKITLEIPHAMFGLDRSSGEVITQQVPPRVYVTWGHATYITNTMAISKLPRLL